MEGGTAFGGRYDQDTKRGILVTRFWYIHSVDQQTQLYIPARLRDSTFYIENGKIMYPVKNFGSTRVR